MDAATWVVIPTYNEAVNLERIVAATRAELDRVAAGDYRILVVDDGSPGRHRQDRGFTGGSLRLR